MDAGYSPQLFWDLSLGEVNDVIESYARRKEHEQKAREAELKDEIMLLFNQALQMGNVLGRLMNKETQLIILRRITRNYTVTRKQRRQRKQISPSRRVGISPR